MEYIGFMLNYNLVFVFTNNVFSINCIHRKSFRLFKILEEIIFEKPKKIYVKFKKYVHLHCSVIYLIYKFDEF